MLNKNTLRKLLVDSSIGNLPTEDLTSYFNGAKRTRRINIPQISETQVEMEEVVSQLIQSFIIAPCLIQINYGQESFSLSTVKTFVSILLEQEELWKIMLKDQSWVSVAFNADTADISFASASMGLDQLETVVKTINTKTSDIVAYQVSQINSQYEIHLKVDGLAHTKFATEGSIL